MERTGIRTEERTGLIVAVILHLLLLAAMVIQGFFPAPQIDRTERMTVSLVDEIGLEATAPDPVPESRAAIAPELSDSPRPPVADAPPQPTENRAAVRDNTPRPRPEQPRQQPQPRPTEKAGGSRIGDNFLEGRGSSANTNETRAPAATFGRSERAALSSAITRALRPHWSVPSGVDSELLVSVVAWRLNPDGTLNGRPRLVSQSGINDSNRAQAALHAERAIRAIQLAQPFKLDERFYDQWDELEWQFDRRL